MKFLFSKLSVYLAITGLIAAVILVGIVGKGDPLPIPIAMPAVKPFDRAIAASGIIESLDRNISIGAPISGLIEHLSVEVGEKVSKDQLLFKIDGRDLQAQLPVLHANVAVAEANLKRVEEQLQRLRSVQDPRAVCIDEVRTRCSDVAIAEAQLKAAQAQVDQAEQLLNRLSVAAPKAGVILQNNIRKGEYFSANSGKAALLLGDISSLQVRTDIDEQNASRFDSAGQAYAYPKNNSELKIPLTFVRIEPYVIPKASLTGGSEERVDTRVLQVLYSFEEPEEFHVYVGQQMDIFISMP